MEINIVIKNVALNQNYIHFYQILCKVFNVLRINQQSVFKTKYIHFTNLLYIQIMLRQYLKTKVYHYLKLNKLRKKNCSQF